MRLVHTINDQRLVIIRNKGIGIASALNTGITQAKGHYIARMDADDFSYPNRLDRQIEYLTEHPAVDVVSCLVEYVAKIPQEGYQFYVNWINTILTPEDHFVNRFVDAPLAHPTIVCTKQVFEEKGMYCENPLPEDFELWLRWMEKGIRFAKVPTVLYQWLDRTNRSSRVSSVYNREKFLKVKSTYAERWISNQPKRNVWIWGYGKKVFRRSQYLSEAGVNICGYIDVRTHPESTRKTIHYSKINELQSALILIYVSDRIGKQRIETYLGEKQYRLGYDYFFMV